jgi:RNA polymerase sigma-70 factor, ECF subfamily
MGGREVATSDDRLWLDEVVPRLYDELRVLARSHLRRERSDHTLSTTAIVHEAWLRLAAQHSPGDQNTGRFFAIASATMRRVLVDYARRHNSDKRGGHTVTVPLGEVEGGDGAFLTSVESEELLALDDALDRLEKVNARAAQVVTHRFFGGRTEEETAQILGVSCKTVHRDWLAARAWLRKEVASDLGLLEDTA